MVCLGNICRSPLAEGILKEQLRNSGISIEVDSAGTSGWHAGEQPDKRSISIAREHHIDITDQKARKIDLSDFDRFDLIFAMDQSVYKDLRNIAPAETLNKVHLFLTYSGSEEMDVPDPWYGGPEDFRHVFNMIREACRQISLKLLNSNR